VNFLFLFSLATSGQVRFIVESGVKHPNRNSLYFVLFLHHNIVYSKSPVYNNINGPGVDIKGPCLNFFEITYEYLLFMNIKLMHGTNYIV
jgi:hypothetical protein